MCTISFSGASISHVLQILLVLLTALWLGWSDINSYYATPIYTALCFLFMPIWWIFSVEEWGSVYPPPYKVPNDKPKFHSSEESNGFTGVTHRAWVGSHWWWCGCPLSRHPAKSSPIMYYEFIHDIFIGTYMESSFSHSLFSLHTISPPKDAKAWLNVHNIGNWETWNVLHITYDSSTNWTSAA